MEIAKEARSEELVAAAEFVFGRLHMCLGNLSDAKQVLARATPLLKEKGSPFYAEQAANQLGLAHSWQLEYGEAEQELQWALTQARQRGTPLNIIASLFGRAMLRANQGNLWEGYQDSREAMELAEQNQERYWLPRLPNTVGYIYHEMLDVETAMRLDREGIQTARGIGAAEPEANAHVNLAHDYMALGEHDRAFEHLQAAEGLLEVDNWYRYRYQTRLRAEQAAYWIDRGDLTKAGDYARQSLGLAEPRLMRKRMAWAHKLLGDVAARQDRVTDALREYSVALGILENHPCPTIEWRILLVAAEIADKCRKFSLSEDYRGCCRQTLQSLADSIPDRDQRRKFLRAKPSHDLRIV